MPFYTYVQNNSGGSFKYHENYGISHFVIVEAHNAKDADEIAEDIGLYFDGEGDCPCCGDRWYPADAYWKDDEGTEVPSIYDVPLSECTFPKNSSAYPYPRGEQFKWMSGYEGFIHYADGHVEGFGK